MIESGEPPLKLLLALPSYSGRAYNLKSVLNAQERHTPFAGIRVSYSKGSSLLCYAFNQLWAKALNARRKEGFTHFCLLHDDVSPQGPTWVTDLYRIMERTRATVLSVVMPMKSYPRNPIPDAVSTALDTTRPTDEWTSSALFTLSQLERDFPPTFTVPNLLINTGLLLIDLRASWVEDVYFQTHEAMFLSPEGEFSAGSVGEDFAFSRELNARGVPLWVTREIPGLHYGIGCWANSSAWRPESAAHMPTIEEGDEHVQGVYREARTTAADPRKRR